MKLFFLDTETSGLDPKNSQIIEIAGILVDFNPITMQVAVQSYFESLVAYRGLNTLDEKITRLTGITTQDLATAKSLASVQKDWLNWLETNLQNQLVQAVVGHSINFDINFLLSEGWFLPDNLGLATLSSSAFNSNDGGLEPLVKPNKKIIDTLNLSKILYPEQEAVNLEHLTENLNLQLNPIFRTKSYHRSLYDTAACIQLFEHLVNKLCQIKASQVFFDTILENFLPLPLQLYSAKLDIQTADEPLSQLLEYEINIDGSLKPPSLSQKIEFLGNGNHFLEFEKILHQLQGLNLPLSLWQVVLQLYYINIYQQNKKNNYQPAKFHSKSKTELLLAELILDLVLELKQELIVDNQNYILPRIESVIWKMRSIMEIEVPMAMLIEHFTLIWQIAKNNQPLNVNQQFIKQAQLLINNFDFLLYSLQNLLDYGEYKYDASALSPKERDVYVKLQNLTDNLNHAVLMLEETIKNHNFEHFTIFNLLLQNTLELAKKCQINPNQQFTFKFVSGQFYMNLVEGRVDLATHFKSLIEKYPGLEVQTYLNQSDLQRLGQMAKMPVDLFNQARYVGAVKGEQNYTHLQIDTQELHYFLDQLLKTAMQEEKPVVIFCGLNSTLNQVTKVLNENFKPNQYLLFGDTGSVTKVMGKLSRGFCGICVLRIQNTESLIRLPNRPSISQCWIVNEPYFPIHSQWIALGKSEGAQEEFIKDLRQIHLHSHLNYLAKNLNCQVNYLQSIT